MSRSVKRSPIINVHRSWSSCWWKALAYKAVRRKSSKLLSAVVKEDDDYLDTILQPTIKSVNNKFSDFYCTKMYSTVDERLGREKWFRK